MLNSLSTTEIHAVFLRLSFPMNVFPYREAWIVEEGKKGIRIHSSSYWSIAPPCIRLDCKRGQAFKLLQFTHPLSQVWLILPAPPRAANKILWPRWAPYLSRAIWWAMTIKILQNEKKAPFVKRRSETLEFGEFPWISCRLRREWLESQETILRGRSRTISVLRFRNGRESVCDRIGRVSCATVFPLPMVPVKNFQQRRGLITPVKRRLTPLNLASVSSWAVFQKGWRNIQGPVRKTILSKLYRWV